jgi:hypothetical protein
MMKAVRRAASLAARFLPRDDLERDRRLVRARASPAESHHQPVQRVDRVAVDPVLLSEELFDSFAFLVGEDPRVGVYRLAVDASACVAGGDADVGVAADSLDLV